MMSIRNLGYIGVYSSEPSNWQQYGTQVLGMEDVTGRYPGEHALLKMDALPWRIAVIKHDSDRFGFSGWETGDEAAFNKVVAQLQGAGVTVTIAGDDEMAQRRVQGLARFTDPSGNQHELYWGRISDYSRLVSPVGVRSFVTGAMGMGMWCCPLPNSTPPQACSLTPWVSVSRTPCGSSSATTPQSRSNASGSCTAIRATTALRCSKWIIPAAVFMRWWKYPMSMKWDAHTTGASHTTCRSQQRWGGI